MGRVSMKMPQRAQSPPISLPGNVDGESSPQLGDDNTRLQTRVAILDTEQQLWFHELLSFYPGWESDLFLFLVVPFFQEVKYCFFTPLVIFFNEFPLVHGSKIITSQVSLLPLFASTHSLSIENRRVWPNQTSSRVQRGFHILIPF